MSNESPRGINYFSFLILVVLVSIGLIVIILPYYSAILWAVILALIFRPLYRRLCRRFPNKPNICALLTLTICVLGAIIPLAIVSASLVAEVVSFYKMVQEGQFNFGQYAADTFSALPESVRSILDHFGASSLVGIQDKLTQAVNQGSKFLATQVVGIGSDAFSFFVALGIMLYLLFFFLRDGDKITSVIVRTVPLNEEQKKTLLGKFATVLKATVLGNFVIAATQGFLGGLIFWILGLHSPLLWGVVMGFLSLLPAVGNAIVWFPVSIYLLVQGHHTSGIALLLWGAVVMGLVDNFLRPLLVGKNTRLPDYIVLMSTLGGLSVFGPNGLVIGPTIAALFLVAWDLFPKHTS